MPPGGGGALRGPAGGVLAVALGLVLMGACGGDDDDAFDPGPYSGRVTELAVDANGCVDPALELDDVAPVLACRLVEAVAAEAATTCLSLGRAPLDRDGDDALEAELRTRLETQQLCGDAVPCGAFAFCEILPALGEADAIAACAADPTLTMPLYCACLNLAEPLNGASGFCYLDPAADLGNPDATDCPAGPALRFISSPAVPLPAPSSPRLFQVCN